MRWLPLLLGTALIFSTGCPRRLPDLRHSDRFSADGGEFTVVFADGDEGAAERVQQAIRRAAPQVARWGALGERVHIHVLPSHDALERAVDRRGFRWLRAWARYDEVLIQSPRTWGLFGASQSEVDELVLHELTHCAMYQAAASRTTWRRKEIPLWFREGMASYTAAQAYRWPGKHQLRTFFREQPGDDPLLEPERLYQAQSDIVYGAAHHAFAELVEQQGETGVRRLLSRMSRGSSFPDAFGQEFGIRPLEFLRGFRTALATPHRASAVPLPPATAEATAEAAVEASGDAGVDAGAPLPADGGAPEELEKESR